MSSGRTRMAGGGLRPIRCRDGQDLGDHAAARLQRLAGSRPRCRSACRAVPRSPRPSSRRRGRGSVVSIRAALRRSRSVAHGLDIGLDLAPLRVRLRQSRFSMLAQPVSFGLELQARLPSRRRGPERRRTATVDGRRVAADTAAAAPVRRRGQHRAASRGDRPRRRGAPESPWAVHAGIELAAKASRGRRTTIRTADRRASRQLRGRRRFGSASQVGTRSSPISAS